MSDIFMDIVRRLAEAKISSPRLEARILMSHILKHDANEIYSQVEVSKEQEHQLNELVQKRVEHYPLDKIIGSREFYKSEFICNENVLSPRPDTEILVEEALKIIEQNKQSKILDLGTGSGCIILSILKEFSTTTGVAVDISEKALEVAKANSKKLNLEQRVSFYCDSWFVDGFCERINDKYDVIVSNPPYIATAEIATLEPEVKKYDPMLALDGGKDGFDSYIKIAEHAPKMLTDNGWILLEAGAGQAQRIGEIFSKQGLKLQAIVCDLSGIERCVILQKSVE